MINFIKKFKHSLCINFIFFVMFGLLAPLEIYAGNTVDFEFGFHDFFWMFLITYGVLWILGSAILASLPLKINKTINTVFTILGIEFYIQYAFFNTKLSTGNGGNMDWNSMKVYTSLNLVVWVAIAIVLIVLSIVLKDKWEKLSRYVLLFISAIQLVAVITLVIQVPKSRVFEYELKIDASKQMAVAPGENIIVLVLDAYSAEEFNNNLKENEEIGTILKDFTYYNNACSIFEGTDYCMNILLTGQIPDDTEDNWRSNCWKPDSVRAFYDTLHNHDYECIISSRDTNNVYGSLEVLEGNFNNVYELPIVLHEDLLFRLLTKMSIYKYVPYVAKPYFEVMYYSFTDVISSIHYDESVYLDPQFYQKLLKDKMYVDKEMNNLFKIQHIQGMHPGYNMDENAFEIPETEGVLEVHMKGLNNIIEEYINCLKETGVYDSATIVMLADHGNALEEFTLQPLVLVKRPNESNAELKIDSSPITHQDFIPTVLDWLGEDYEGYASGTSIYDWHENDKRDRSVTVLGITYNYNYNLYESEELLKQFKQDVDNKKKELNY